MTGRSTILFWVASRGHHADVGGISPGSMSPNATTIEEEGVLFDNFKLVDRGRFREKELYDALNGAKYPARNPLQNVNDMKAQIAANEKGVHELRKMVAHFTLPVVKAYMKHVQDNAAESVRRVIDRLHDSSFDYPMDLGTTIRVKISVDKEKREATVDFTGTSEQQPNNFNAPEPVARAAVLYVFRVMVDDDIPMNAGCLRPINIIIPKRTMLTPEYPAAVVAGNVEVSQAVTNCLFGALGAIACAQGTMNNVNFGNDKYQYYETICSGSPAGPGFPGTDAVHTHMTNTRLTDPEILEFRYPVVLEDFHIRKGSGGKGKWNAGDGIRRTIRFLEKMDCTLLTGHRVVPPFGLAGGENGQVGQNSVRRLDGSIEKLKGCDATVIDAGEALIIQTPTAGGYGKADLKSFSLGPFLPQLPRPRDISRLPIGHVVALGVGEVAHLAAEPDRDGLQPRVHLGVDRAEHRVLQRGADHDIAVPAHQHHDPVAERARQRVAELAVAHQHLAVTGVLADLVRRHPAIEERAEMEYRAQRHVADAERDHGRRVAVHDRLHVGPRLIDRAVNEALGEQPRLRRLHRSRSEIEFENVARGDQRGSQRARHQVAGRIGRVADADVPIGVEHAFVGEDAARRRQFRDRRRLAGRRGGRLRARALREDQRHGNENGRHPRNHRCH